jgi:uncharacterized protein (TIGR02246 family)
LQAGELQDRETDQAAIRGLVAAFVKAFDCHDAKAIGELFLPDAKVITEDGLVVEGREGIAQVFADQFSENPEAKIEVQVDSIKFIGSDLAIEVGSTKMTPGPGEAPEISRYTVVHAKRNGKWQMALARDAEGDTPTPHDRLQSLGWLVGDWIDESPVAVVFTSCRWSQDKNFLLQDIQVTTAGKATMTVNQRIGWDPMRTCVRSWVFDSEGGFGEGTWARTEDGWMIKVTGVRSDGSTASSTNTVTMDGKDAYVWQSADRVIGGAVSDPVEVRVVRKPPQSNRKD